jgi:hypothetical protein
MFEDSKRPLATHRRRSRALALASHEIPVQAPPRNPSQRPQLSPTRFPEERIDVEPTRKSPRQGVEVGLHEARVEPGLRPRPRPAGRSVS